MFMLQKYYKLFFFLTICSVFCSNCGFPYHTRQARDARKAKRLVQKQQKKEQALAQQDSSAILLPELDSTDTDVVWDTIFPPDQTTIPERSVPKTITIVRSDSASMDSLSNVITALDSLPQDSIPIGSNVDSTILDSLTRPSPIQQSIESTCQELG